MEQHFATGSLIQPQQQAGVPARLTISMKEFCQLSGIGKSKAWQLIRDGQLAVTRIGRRTLISYESAIALVAPDLHETYLASLPAAAPVHAASFSAGGQA